MSAHAKDSHTKRKISPPSYTPPPTYTTATLLPPPPPPPLSSSSVCGVVSRKWARGGRATPASPRPPQNHPFPPPLDKKNPPRPPPSLPSQPQCMKGKEARVAVVTCLSSTHQLHLSCPGWRKEGKGGKESSPAFHGWMPETDIEGGRRRSGATTTSSTAL